MKVKTPSLKKRSGVFCYFGSANSKARDREGADLKSQGLLEDRMIIIGGIELLKGIPLFELIINPRNELKKMEVKMLMKFCAYFF